MNAITRWWGERSDGEKKALLIGGSVAVVATGGAVAWAVATQGAVVTIATASGATVTAAVGKAARALIRSGRV